MAEPAPLDTVTIRRLHQARPDDASRSQWAEAWGVALCDEIVRLRLSLDHARRGEDYYQRTYERRDTDQYRALVERTAERDQAKASLRAVRAIHRLEATDCACCQICAGCQGMWPCSTERAIADRIGEVR